MKKILRYISFILIVSYYPTSEANWLADIVNRIEQTNVISSNILQSQNQLLDAERELLSSQKDIESLMKEVHSSVIGHSGWGTYQSHDYATFGESAHDWAAVMKMIDSGSGSGALSQTIQNIAGQFPIDKNSFNQGISNRNSQTYYAVQAQTILATRAASQLDYDTIQHQIAYQQMLQQQIENTNDLKAAVDLNNRIQVEANLIQLAMLRQSALSNQQHAISEQGNINTALLNAKFLVPISSTK